MAYDYAVNPTEFTVGGTANAFATNELPVDMYSKTMKAFPELTPLTSLLTKLGEQPASNFRIDWQEEVDIPTTMVVSSALASGGTDLVVQANANVLVEDTLLFNPRTFDIAKVASAPGSDTAVTIARSHGGTTAAAWVAGDVLHVLPPSVPEDDEDNYRVASVADENVYNYTQLIRMNYSITRLANKMKTFHGGPGEKRQSLKRQKYREFRKLWEKLIMFGGRASSGTAPATIYQSGGLVHFLRNGTLYKNFNGVLTESGLRNYFGDFKDQNPDSTKVSMFAAGNVIDVITGFGLPKTQISPTSKALGLDIQTYITRGLTVELIPLPLLVDPETRGWGWILDMSRIKMRTIDKPTWYPDAKDIGVSERIYDMYRVATSLLLANESRHSMFIGAQN